MDYIVIGGKDMVELEKVSNEELLAECKKRGYHDFKKSLVIKYSLSDFEDIVKE